MMIKRRWVEIRQLSAAGGPTARELWIDDRAASGTYLSALSSALSPSNTEVYTLSHTCAHTHLHTDGPHIPCTVTACSLSFGSQYCNTALWLKSWSVCVCLFVCLHSVRQLCYDVIWEVFLAASRFSLSSLLTTTSSSTHICTHHSLICHLNATHSFKQIV